MTEQLTLFTFLSLNYLLSLCLINKKSNSVFFPNVFIQFIFIEAQLIHSIMLVSSTQQSDSVIRIQTYIDQINIYTQIFFFRFFSVIGDYKTLSILPCATQQDLVGYPFYIQWCVLVTQLCPTLCDPLDCNQPSSSVHGDSPGKNPGVGCHALLQGIFSTQEKNLDSLHCRQILDHVSHQRSIYNGQPRTPDLFLPYAFPSGNHKFVFYVYESISVL